MNHNALNSLSFGFSSKKMAGPEKNYINKYSNNTFLMYKIKNSHAKKYTKTTRTYFKELTLILLVHSGSKLKGKGREGERNVKRGKNSKNYSFRVNRLNTTSCTTYQTISL